jgi:beta-xylosidase
MKTISTIIILLISLSSSMLTYSQVINPRTLPQEWGEYGIGDPYILKFKGKFYLYCSTRDDQAGVKCWSSWDLSSWNYEGLCVANTVTTSKGAYAPEVIYWNGTFYMYTSPAGNGHYILSAPNPTGPFTVQTGNLGRTIDGSVFIDDNAQMYFTYAGGSGIQGAAMSGPLSITGAGGTLSGTSLNGWTEGSTLFKRNGLYYITYTGNHVFSRGYRVHYATAATPLGGYTAGDNNPIVLNTEGYFFGLGHSGSFIVPDLDLWFMAFIKLLRPTSQL